MSDSKVVNMTEEINDKENVLVVKNLKKYFPIKKDIFGRGLTFVKAVDGISFTIKRGTTMGLVGESGCGKSTAGRTLLRLQDKTDGEVYFNGKEIFDLSKDELRKKDQKYKLYFKIHSQVFHLDYQLVKSLEKVLENTKLYLKKNLMHI